MPPTPADRLSRIAPCGRCSAGERRPAGRRERGEAAPPRTIRASGAAVPDGPAEGPARGRRPDAGVRGARGDGKFHGADPARGRFRNYVKTALFHLRQRRHARGHKAAPRWRSRRTPGCWRGWRPRTTTSGRSRRLAGRDPAPDVGGAGRREPGLPRGTAVAGRTPRGVVGATGGAACWPAATAANVRQTLRRARELFTSLLREEVAHRWTRRRAEAVDEELAELGLLKYTRA